LTSGARIGKLKPSSLDEEQHSLYDAIAGGRRAQGPQLFRLVDEAVARSAGLDDAELAAVREGRDAALTGREAVVARTAAALVVRGDLDDAEYLEAVEVVGAAGLFELLTLVGYYATLALQLRVFRVPAPDGAAPPS